MVTNKVYSPKAQRLVELNFVKLEADGFASFRRNAQHENALMQLQKVTGLENRELLQRLLRAGFTAQNIHAITWLPVVMVAWASDGVSPEEIRASQLLKLDTQNPDSSETTQLFQAWLAKKPSHELWQLWEEYTRARAAVQPAQLHVHTGYMILEMSRRVARASGGVLGFGQVSTAEYEILNRIRAVYSLPD